MNKAEFLTEFKNAINREAEIMENMDLSELAEWDSLGMMCVVTMFEDCFSIGLDFSEMEQFKTVKDLMNRAGIIDE